MLLASTGVRQNPTITAHRMLRPIPTISPVSRQPQGPPPTARAAIPAVTLTTPQHPHPPMEAHIRVISPRPLPLLPGHRQRTHTRHTPSPEDAITRRNRPTPHTQPRLLIRTDDRLHPSRLHTLPQGILVTMTSPFRSIAKPPRSATAAAPGYYIASDGRQYPLSQQPQASRNPQSGTSRYSTR
jgi:hypothetical protein